MINLCNNLPDGLGCIRVKDNAAFPCDFRDLFNRLDRSHLIVRVHHRNQNRPGGDGFLNALRIDSSVSVHRNKRYFCPKFLKKSTGVDYSGMLDLRGDDMVSFFPQREENPFDGVVVGLASTTGKDNLIRRTLEKLRHLLPCMLNSFFSRNPCPMKARRITKMLREEWLHCLRHFWGNGGTCIEIEINTLSAHSRLLSQECRDIVFQD